MPSRRCSCDLSYPPVQVVSDIHGSTVELESPAKKPCLQPMQSKRQGSTHSQLSPDMERLGSRDMGASEKGPAQQQIMPLSSSREAELRAAPAPESNGSVAMLIRDGGHGASAPGMQSIQVESKHPNLRSSVLPQGCNAVSVGDAFLNKPDMHLSTCLMCCLELGDTQKPGYPLLVSARYNDLEMILCSAGDKGRTPAQHSKPDLFNAFAAFDCMGEGP